MQVWGEELQTGSLPRSEVLEAERAARQLEDQVAIQYIVHPLDELLKAHWVGVFWLVFSDKY